MVKLFLMNQLQQTVIFFVRHGLTDQPYSLNPEIDAKRVLTEQGKKQIAKVGEYLRAFAPTAIYSSPLKRTLETAEIIRSKAEIAAKIESKNELLEIYSDSDYQALSQKIPALMNQLATKHPGEHIVCTSHQDVIEGGLKALGVEAEEADFPCLMAQLYRLVFAGNTFVEATKLDPAASIH